MLCVGTLGLGAAGGAGTCAMSEAGLIASVVGAAALAVGGAASFLPPCPLPLRRGECGLAFVLPLPPSPRLRGDGARHQSPFGPL